MKRGPSIGPVWVPSKPEPETKTWVQVVYLKVDPRKQEKETGKETNKGCTTGAPSPRGPSQDLLRNCVKLVSELSFL